MRRNGGEGACPQQAKTITNNRASGLPRAVLLNAGGVAFSWVARFDQAQFVLGQMREMSRGEWSFCDE